MSATQNTPEGLILFVGGFNTVNGEDEITILIGVVTNNKPSHESDIALYFMIEQVTNLKK